MMIHDDIKKIHDDDLDDGYNVVSERETSIKTRSLWHKNHYVKYKNKILFKQL